MAQLQHMLFPEDQICFHYNNNNGIIIKLYERYIWNGIKLAIKKHRIRTALLKLTKIETYKEIAQWYQNYVANYIFIHIFPCLVKHCHI